MDYKTFYKTIDALPPVLLFCGPEEYVKKSALDALRAKLLPEDFAVLNEATLEGAQPLARLEETLEALPVLSDYRLTVIKESPLVLPAKRENAADKSEDAQALAYLQNMPETSKLVFYCGQEKPLKTKKLVKWIEAQGGLVEFDYLEQPDMARWCKSYLSPLKKQLDRAALAEIQARVGPSVTEMKNALDKLSGYAMERADITLADVELLITPTVEQSVFRVMDLAIAGDGTQALAIVAKLLEQGEQPHGLLAVFLNTCRRLALCKKILAAGGGEPQVAQALSVAPFVARRLAGQCRKIPQSALVRNVAYLVECDYNIKNGRIAVENALYSAILTVMENIKSR